MTQQKYFQQCMIENSTQIAVINDEEIKLSEQECIEACHNWAQMKIVQDQLEQNK